MSSNYWIDFHTHIDKLEISPELAISEAAKAGVRQMITIGTEPRDHPIVLELARKFYPTVVCTLGVHPHDAKLWDDSVESNIFSMAQDQKVVAIGEIGLDYYYEHTDRIQQIEVFRKQMSLAEKLNLPVEIHTRDADSETIQVMKEFKGRVQGVLHCFSGTAELRDAAIELDYHFSISGILTFKNAQGLRDIVRKIPLERIQVETDAPFLAPIPFRGKKNQPAYLPHTATVLSELFQVSVDDLQRITTENAKRILRRLPSIN